MKPSDVDVILVNGCILFFGVGGLMQGIGGFAVGLTLFLLVIVNAYFLTRNRWPILKRIVGWMYGAVLAFGLIVFLADIVVLLITGKEWIPLVGHPHYEPDETGKDRLEMRAPEVRPVIPRR
jgi:hypothetical protein